MFLYCIANESGYCKFGFSREPSRRLRALQTGSGETLRLIETLAVEADRVRELERLLHTEIGLHRRVRGEWFSISGEEGAQLMAWFEIRYLSPCSE